AGATRLTALRGALGAIARAIAAHALTGARAAVAASSVAAGAAAVAAATVASGAAAVATARSPAVAASATAAEPVCARRHTHRQRSHGESGGDNDALHFNVLLTLAASHSARPGGRRAVCRSYNTHTPIHPQSHTSLHPPALASSVAIGGKSPSQ